jgi:hypothetical protein
VKPGIVFWKASTGDSKRKKTILTEMIEGKLSQRKKISLISRPFIAHLFPFAPKIAI